MDCDGKFAQLYIPIQTSKTYVSVEQSTTVGSKYDWFRLYYYHFPMVLSELNCKTRWSEHLSYHHLSVVVHSMYVVVAVVFNTSFMITA